MIAILFSIFMLIASSLSWCMEESPNKQDVSGNTKLHRAVLTWQNLNNAAKAKASEDKKLEALLKSKTAAFNQELNPANRKRLVQEHTEIKTLRAQIRTEYHSLTQQRAVVYNSIPELLIQGWVINLANYNGKTAEQLCPEMFKTFVYLPLKHALKQEDLAPARELLSYGANPNFVVDNHCALEWCARLYSAQSSKLLLEFGANISFPNDLQIGNLFHTLGLIKKVTHIEELLVTPCGTQYRTANIPARLQKVNDQLFTVLLCLNRSQIYLSAEMRTMLLGYLLPDASELINLVPLYQLARYKHAAGINKLCTALTKRHIKLLNTALKAKMGNQLTPKDFTLILNNDLYNEGIVACPPNECTFLLDPALQAVDQRAHVIFDNYKALLNK